MQPATDAKVERLTRELHALTEVAKTLTSTIGLQELLGAIMAKIIGVLEPAEIGAIMLWDQAAGTLPALGGFRIRIRGFQSHRAAWGRMHHRKSL